MQSRSTQCIENHHSSPTFMQQLTSKMLTRSPLRQVDRPPARVAAPVPVLLPRVAALLQGRAPRPFRHKQPHQHLCGAHARAGKMVIEVGGNGTNIYKDTPAPARPPPPTPGVRAHRKRRRQRAGQAIRGQPCQRVRAARPAPKARASGMRRKWRPRPRRCARRRC
jgi:hypothetical protein